MSVQKKTITKEKIISAAFREWGKTCFYKTNLSVVSDNLSITKTALYRHFKNKKDLLRAMKEKFYQEYEKIKQSFILSAKEQTVEESVALFFKNYLPFFFNKPSYFHFIVFLISEEIRKKRKLAQEFFIDEQMLFSNVLENNGYQVTEKIQNIFFRMIIAVGSLYLKTELSGKKQSKINNLEEVTKGLSGIVLYGIWNREKLSQPSFKKILDDCTITRYQREPQDRIFSGIANVVAKEGILDSTTEKIARKLGMSKSSLYFYFKNRDEMLSKMIFQKVSEFQRFLYQSLEKYTSLEEKTFCFFVTLSSYLAYDPTVLTVFNWIWLQRIELNLTPPKPEEIKDIAGFIYKAVENGNFNKYIFTHEQIAALIVREVVQETIAGFRRNESKEEILNSMEYVFFLLNKGIIYYKNQRRVQ